MANLKLIAKCGFAVLLVISIAVLIERLTAKRYYTDSDSSGTGSLVVTDTSLPVVGSTIDPFINQDLMKCITDHTKSNHFQIYRENMNSQDEVSKLDIEESETKLQNTSTSCNLSSGLCMLYLLKDLSNLMKILDIKLQLIEPSVLFCLLPSTRRFNLLTRGFHPKKMKGSKNVLTFGMSENSVELLDKKSSRRKVISAKFRIERFPKNAKFKRGNDDEPEAAFETLHYFLKRWDMVMHLVVFYPRETFLWHPGFDVTNVNVKDLLYVNDGVFENSSFLPMKLQMLPQIFIPSDSRYYLLDMESSKFLECKSALDTLSIESNNAPNKKQLDKQAYAAIKVLKTVLGAEMIFFWLWSRSLLGWYENCDVLHYSSDLQFSVTKKSVQGYNLTALFASSECRPTEQNFDLDVETKLELNCEGMPVHIFIMHEENNTFWYQINEEENSYNVTFPVFTRCSTAVSGQKVNVPCEIDKIFETEYGQNWRSASLDFDPKYMMNAYPIRKTENDTGS